MPRKIGDNYRLFAGETLSITKTATRQDGTLIENIKSAILGIQQDLVSTTRDCTFDESEVTGEIPEADTKYMFGDYRYIITVTEDDGTNTAIAFGKITVESSPVYGLSPGL